ncbi:hypothetical protein ABKA04_004777 [Annulohypoxylon sp. FPYF3050]
MGSIKGDITWIAGDRLLFHFDGYQSTALEYSAQINPTLPNFGTLKASLTYKTDEYFNGSRTFRGIFGKDKFAFSFDFPPEAEASINGSVHPATDQKIVINDELNDQLQSSIPET